MTPDYLNTLSSAIYLQNCAVGWWDNPNRCLYECLQLVSTEVAEATEGARKDLMDDHLPHRKMEEVELADALIRVLDLGGCLGLQVREVVIATELIEADIYTDVVCLICTIAAHRGYDIRAAMEEKLEYNRRRADHKRENRAQAHGKKF